LSAGLRGGHCEEYNLGAFCFPPIPDSVPGWVEPRGQGGTTNQFGRCLRLFRSPRAQSNRRKKTFWGTPDENGGAPFGGTACPEGGNLEFPPRHFAAFPWRAKGNPVHGSPRQCHRFAPCLDVGGRRWAPQGRAEPGAEGRGTSSAVSGKRAPQEEAHRGGGGGFKSSGPSRVENWFSRFVATGDVWQRSRCGEGKAPGRRRQVGRRGVWVVFGFCVRSGCLTPRGLGRDASIRVKPFTPRPRGGKKNATDPPVAWGIAPDRAWGGVSPRLGPHWIGPLGANHTGPNLHRIRFEAVLHFFTGGRVGGGDWSWARAPMRQRIYGAISPGNLRG